MIIPENHIYQVSGGNNSNITNLISYTYLKVCNENILHAMQPVVKKQDYIHQNIYNNNNKKFNTLIP